jgi:hypothetical protein
VQLRCSVVSTSLACMPTVHVSLSLSCGLPIPKVCLLSTGTAQRAWSLCTRRACSRTVRAAFTVSCRGSTSLTPESYTVVRCVVAARSILGLLVVTCDQPYCQVQDIQAIACTEGLPDLMAKAAALRDKGHRVVSFSAKVSNSRTAFGGLAPL